MHTMPSPATYGSGLPLPVLLPLTDASALPALYCVVTPIDARGRLADSTPVTVAGWSPGQPVTLTTTTTTATNPHHMPPPYRLIHPRINVHATDDNDAPHRITRQGHLRIPAPLRHLCGLTTGTRLLVTIATTTGPATGPVRGLTVYPMAALAEILKHAGAGGNP